MSTKNPAGIFQWDDIKSVDKCVCYYLNDESSNE